jgi:hypothetical protein
MYNILSHKINSYTSPSTNITVPMSIDITNDWESYDAQTLYKIHKDMMREYISCAESQEILRTLHYVMYYNARVMRLRDGCVLTMHDINLPSYKADESMATQEAAEKYLAAESEDISYCMTRHVLEQHNITYIEEE